MATSAEECYSRHIARRHAVFNEQTSAYLNVFSLGAHLKPCVTTEGGPTARFVAVFGNCLVEFLGFLDPCFRSSPSVKCCITFFPFSLAPLARPPLLSLPSHIRRGTAEDGGGARGALLLNETIGGERAKRGSAMSSGETLGQAKSIISPSTSTRPETLWNFCIKHGSNYTF